MKSFVSIMEFLFTSSVCINLHKCGWADSLTGDQKIIFALQLALFNAGKGLGYKIEFKSKPVKDSAVYNPYHFDVTASTMTSSGSLGETWEHIKFQFVSKSYSVRSIYEGAIGAL